MQMTRLLCDSEQIVGYETEIVSFCTELVHEGRLYGFREQLCSAKIRTEMIEHKICLRTSALGSRRPTHRSSNEPWRSTSSFSFVNHVDAILKICSQRIFLLKQLREQGTPLDQLHTVFQAIILNRLTYAILVWGPYLNVELKQRIDAFLKRSFCYGFSK